MKIVKKLGEDAKIGIRNERRGSNDIVKDLQKESEISEDDMHRALTKVQQLTDKAVGEVDEITAAKEKEILEF